MSFDRVEDAGWPVDGLDTAQTGTEWFVWNNTKEQVPQETPLEDVIVEEIGLAFNEEGRRTRRSTVKKNAGAAALLALLIQMRPYFEAANAFVQALVSVLLTRLGISKLFKTFWDAASSMRKQVARTTQSQFRAAIGAAGFAAIYWASKQRDWSKAKPRAKRVAIVGSGIAGSGAAWALNKAGVDIILYEKKPKVGGNAKAMTWNVNGKKVETGLAVFAWPQNLFHNYNAMIKEIGMETEDHETKFYVTERDEKGNIDCVFAHDKKGWKPQKWLQSDLEKWDSLVKFVKRVNGVLQPSEIPSCYRMGFLNPLNMIPLQKFCKLWGISEKFWNLVFVPIHTSTFLEVEMGTVPASMAELLDEIVPFSRTPKLRTWKTHAYDAICRLLAKIDPNKIKTSCAVETVQYIPRQSATARGQFDVVVLDEDGREEVFDAIIFACSAPAMNRILHGKGASSPAAVVHPNPQNGLNNQGGWLSVKPRLQNWLEGLLLSKTMYTTDRDKAFERGVVHSDANAVLPDKHREDVLDAYCNYIEVDKTNPRNLENTFVISSWAPTAQDPDVKGKLPMLVTYNAEKKLEQVDTEWVSTSREAHPCLTFWQLVSSVMLWPFLQGARGAQTYFCGSAVLPANGHDLSFLSGLVIASELGAPYPFPNDPNAWSDFLRLRSMMLSLWA